MQKHRYIFIVYITLLTSAIAGKYTGTRVSTRLYTPLDSSASGGIQATVKGKPVLQSFAISASNRKHVYQGEVSEDGKSFVFAGLPVDKYDLLLLCKNKFYEGITLFKQSDSLTKKDYKLIEFIINKSHPFFELKKIDRCLGATGEKGKACCILQELRARPIKLQSAEVRSDIQIRSIKIAELEDVGKAGWQLIYTREIVRTEVGPPDVKGILPHAYEPSLTGIRVIDSIKDLGEIHIK